MTRLHWSVCICMVRQCNRLCCHPRGCQLSTQSFTPQMIHVTHVQTLLAEFCTQKVRVYIRQRRHTKSSAVHALRYCSASVQSWGASSDDEEGLPVTAGTANHAPWNGAEHS